MEKLFQELEERLLKPEVRRSGAALDRLLADDFLEIGQSGRRFTKQQVINSLTASEETEEPIRVEEFSIKYICSGEVIQTLFRTVRPDGNSALRSSFWRQYPSGWQMFFHQGTPEI